jgi:hypothetical protein
MATIQPNAPQSFPVDASRTPRVAAMAEWDRRWELNEQIKEAARIAALPPAPPLSFADHLYDTDVP